MNNLSDNLKKIRKDNNLSQEQLADTLGVSRQAISKWESGAAYPEMEKLVQICQKFDVNIDDLLNKDIREVKSEEESKKSINKYIDDFLNFISDTVNLFSSMKFKSKLKCLFEQCVLMFILFMIFLIIGSVLSPIVYSLLQVFIGRRFSYGIHDFFVGIYIIFALAVSCIILIHVFKTRYLDYFIDVKKKIEVNDGDRHEGDSIKNEKIELSNDDKIIIRDPKHSEYKFINGFFKTIILCIKFFALLFALFLCFFVICFVAVSTISFLFIKTGLLFVGFILGMLSISVGTIIIILLLFNFIFNRKNDKKKMIFTFIGAVIVLGLSCGLLFISSLKFDFTLNDSELITTKKLELNMSDDLILSILNSNVQYIESDIDNVMIEYDIVKFFTLDDANWDDSYFHHFYVECTEPMNAVRYVLEQINNYKISSFDDGLSNIKVYANSNNINILKTNIANYNNELKIRDAENNYYENLIEDLYDEINDKDNMIDELNFKLDEKDEEIDELKNKINSLFNE